jgi:hypothetical protein|nr:MAG TPA: winged helix-turn-helix DNA-binding protein [Caudoviricetes sp.]
MKFPNQKTVVIANKELMDNIHTYQRLTNETAIEVGKLSLWGIRVWFYLNKNKERFELELSPQAILNWYGITTDCRKGVRNGIQELFDKGFLQQEGEKLVFYQKPPAG